MKQAESMQGYPFFQESQPNTNARHPGSTSAPRTDSNQTPRQSTNSAATHTAPQIAST